MWNPFRLKVPEAPTTQRHPYLPHPQSVVGSTRVERASDATSTAHGLAAPDLSRPVPASNAPLPRNARFAPRPLKPLPAMPVPSPLPATDNIQDVQNTVAPARLEAFLESTDHLVRDPAGTRDAQETSRTTHMVERVLDLTTLKQTEALHAADILKRLPVGLFESARLASDCLEKAMVDSTRPEPGDPTLTEVVAASLMLARKVFNDKTFRHADWGRVTELDPERLQQAELAVLKAIDWKVMSPSRPLGNVGSGQPESPRFPAQPVR